MTTEHEGSSEPTWLAEVVRELQEPLSRAPAAVDSVVAAALESRRSPARLAGKKGLLAGLWRWATETRFSLNPLSASVVAGAVSVLTAVTISVIGSPSVPPAVERHQFVLVAPEAHSVSLAGDFNGWDISATPLERLGDVWSVELPLSAGRHVYSFVVDGEVWVPDLSAPRAPDDGFGRPSSVVFVAGSGT